MTRPLPHRPHAEDAIVGDVWIEPVEDFTDLHFSVFHSQVYLALDPYTFSDVASIS